MNTNKSSLALLCFLALPGTAPLTLSGDPVRQMVEGIGAWLARETAASAAHRKPSRERLRYILGVVDPRVAFDKPELTKLRETASSTVYAARWPVLEGVHAEGLLYEPRGAVKSRAIVLPDVDQSPEDVAAREGAMVLVPVILDRRSTWSGNPKIGKMTEQSHREFLYRMTFALGRHPLGYEVQKVLAAVDWFAKSPGPIEVRGKGEGGLIALFAAALDTRIDTAVIRGYAGRTGICGRSRSTTMCGACYGTSAGRNWNRSAVRW
jgi:hypothetical protein